MTTIEATGSAPPPGVAVALPAGSARFLGPVDAFWALLIRGALLLMVTLGIYRFWLATDIRRYLWANTEIAGDGLEYLGTARELLIGFLTAIAILVPVYAGFFLAALDSGPGGRWVSVIAFLLLAVLGQFAAYRARRYRLTRTIFRGLRFHQTGSGWRYAICAMFWWILSAVTLGLAYPWGQASLERYKMRNTYYGDLQGRFVGSGARLLLRGLPLWIVTVLPLLLGILVPAFTVDWEAIPDMVKGGGADFGKFEGANPALAAALVLPGLAVAWTLIAGALLYPAFQGIVLKWWVAGLRFGDVTVATRLRKRSVYGVYMRFLWHSLAFGVVIGIVAAILLAAVGGGLTVLDKDGTLGRSTAVEIGMIAATVVVYVAMMLGFSAIFQATVRIGLWRVGFESIEVHGLAALDRVKAVAQPSTALGEGLADALNVGGY